MRLSVGNTNCVLCPIRGEIPVNTCGACPLLTRLRSRAGRTTVVCRGPNGTTPSNPGGGWVASRSLLGRY